MRIVMIAMALVLTVACRPVDPPNAEDRAVAGKSVALLFEHEGVRVYRFGDGTRYHYYVVARDGSALALSPAPCGKGCVEDEEIQTLLEQP